MQTNLSMQDLSDIRDAVPQLDLQSIRSLRRAGFDLVRSEPEAPAMSHRLWSMIPRPMTSSLLQAEHTAAE